jgi:hypothetical protein
MFHLFFMFIVKGLRNRSPSGMSETSGDDQYSDRSLEQPNFENKDFNANLYSPRNSQRGNPLNGLGGGGGEGNSKKNR